MHAVGGEKGKISFLDQMRAHMPRQHRTYLDLLSTNRTRLRDHVKSSNSEVLKAAYNRAVNALKEFRNHRIRFVTLYIVSPARRQLVSLSQEKSKEVEVTGTSGSDVMHALKAIRNSNANSTL